MDNLQDLATTLPNTTESEKSPYGYIPLSPGSIRLLTLLPSSPEYPNILTCSLKEVPLSSKPDYRALSYTWGSNTFTHTLHISPTSSILHITHNLYDALVNFRDHPFDEKNEGGEKEGVKLWVDAICIDQSSPPEKAHQIPLMAEIYAQAESVLIWLGPPSSGTPDALNYLSKVGRGFLDRSVGSKIQEPKIEENDPEFGEENKVLWKMVYGAENSEAMKKSDDIWARSWFGRRWIVQELCFARRASVYVGKGKIEWEELALAAEALSVLDGGGATFVNRRTGGLKSGKKPENGEKELAAKGLSNVVKLERMRKRMLEPNAEGEGERGNVGIFDDARGFECRDDKDRIFALLGIFNYGRKEKFEIGYEKKEAEVFDAFARFCLREEGGVGILSWAGMGNQALCGERLGLPSWVPDWRLPLRFHGDMLRGFDAGGGRRCEVEVDEEGKEIAVMGRYLDAIITTAPSAGQLEEEELAAGMPPWRFMEPGYIAMWYQVVELTMLAAFKVIHGAGEEEYIGGGGSIWEALAKTLILDTREVFFDYKRHPGNVVPKHVPSDFPQPQLPDEFVAFRNWIFLKYGDLTKTPVPRDPNEPGVMFMMDYEMMEYFSRAVDASQERSFFVTSKGIIGLGPRDLQDGDFLCLFAGSKVPCILRQQERSSNEDTQAANVDAATGQTNYGKFQLLGECYVHGLMRGELVPEDDDAVDIFVDKFVLL
ncbi:heterokaryon incompatibility protein-domain-containing protein [Halenospora varia]|nr:heterokaryon incompatibility protein-domain-containing protein [Halenospora varia]